MDGSVTLQDIFYLFVVPNEQFVTRMIFGENDKELSKHMISAWTRFAQTGYIDQSFGGQRWEQALQTAAMVIWHIISI